MTQWASDDFVGVTAENRAKTWHIVCNGECNRDHGRFLNLGPVRITKATITSSEKRHLIVAGFDYSELSRLALHQAFQRNRPVAHAVVNFS